MSDTESDLLLDPYSLVTVAEVLKITLTVLKKKYFPYSYPVSVIDHIITFPARINAFCKRASESHFKKCHNHFKKALKVESTACLNFLSALQKKSPVWISLFYFQEMLLCFCALYVIVYFIEEMKAFE